MFQHFAFSAISYVFCTVLAKCPYEQCHIIIDFVCPQTYIFPRFTFHVPSHDYEIHPTLQFTD